MSRSNTPNPPEPLSNDALHYTARERDTLVNLSTLNIGVFFTSTAQDAASSVLQDLCSVAASLLGRPRVPLPDPNTMTRLCMERDQAREQARNLENTQTTMSAEGNRLAERVTELEANVQDLQADNTSYQERINVLQSDLCHERENLVALRNAVANAQPAPPPSSFPVPDPERYDRNRKRLPLFKSHLLMKLQGDDARFPTEQHKLRYTVGLLQGNAFAQIQPYILETTINFTNVTALLDVLEAAFGDPDRTGTAERKLESLKQANRDFSTYYAEFSRHVANTQWNDATKKTALSRGLSNEIKDALALAD